jgi:aminopeptidase N
MKRILVLAATTLFWASSLAAQRLPSTAIPESYDLTFEPQLTAATFKGNETIHVRLLNRMTSITLNSAEIEFQEVKITAGGLSQTAVAKSDENTEMTTLTVAKPLPAGPADIQIRFTGILNDKLRGFYLSETSRRKYAVTQFESTDARRAFPSFDEPAFKAVFRITLILDKADTAISNGRILSDTAGPGADKHTITFAPSPKMSTYLVAMLVGDFVCREGAAGAIPIRVCAVPEKQALTGYALTATEGILKFYNQYYSQKYPFGKLDIVAIPDFAAGAMENTAAITFRESFVLIDKNTSSADAMQTATNVIAHEIAHQWFGDLVTMKWWDDLWLNEGFATWMAWKPIKVLHPEWYGEQQESQETATALATDSIASVRTIRAKAETPADIAALFDNVAYQKAASVLRMVEAYTGPDLFRKGVNAYLQKHAYANATAEDFWNQLTTTSGKPVNKIMAGFTSQPGAPLLRVQTTCRGKTTEVTLRQTRYIADREKLEAGSNETWQIPVSMRPAGSQQTIYRNLTERQQTFSISGCVPWVYVNAGARGYYRSDYDSTTLGKMAAEIETAFSAEERVQFLGDMWAMVRVGRVNVGDYLAIVEKMGKERSSVVMTIIGRRFADIHDTISRAEDRPAVEAWISKLIRPIADDLADQPLAKESDDRRVLRSAVVRILAAFGRDRQTLRQLRTVVDAFMKTPETIDAAVAEIALTVSAQEGDATLYDQYVQHLKTAKTPEEYYAYLYALGSFRDPSLLKRTYELALSPEVKNQDMYVLYASFTDYATQSASWELFKANFAAIQKKVDPYTLVAFAQGTGVFCDARLRDDSQEFFAKLQLSGSERILRNVRDSINSCLELRALQQENLTAYLKRD